MSKGLSNVAELKVTNLEKAKGILKAKGLNFTNIGITNEIKINTLSVDYSPELKLKVLDITKNIGISERAAIALLLEAEIGKIKIDETIDAAAKSISDANTIIGKAKVVEAYKEIEGVTKAEIKKAVKLVKIDEVLKEEINETAKNVCHTKSLIYPQITISDITIKFANIHEITGVIAVADTRDKAKKLMQKTGITSERVVLVYMFEKILTYIPKAKVSDKSFTLKLGESSISITIDANNKFTFHQKLEYQKLANHAFELQNKIVSLVKVGNVHENLKKVSDHLNKFTVDSFRKSINILEDFAI